MNHDLDSIIADICSTEDIFKLKNETVRGVNYKCFDSKLSNLNHYFQLSSQYSDKEMLVFKDERYTYEESYNLSSSFANALIENFDVKKAIELPLLQEIIRNG